MLHCKAKPVLTSTQINKSHKGYHPVVISAKRYDGILSRAHQEEVQTKLAAVEEERRYRQYLKDGNDALVKLFKGMDSRQEDNLAEMALKRDDPLAEGKPLDLYTKRLADQMRKERILRANEMLENMKPGPRLLHSALLQSEIIRQRRYNEQLNREFAQNLERQNYIEEQRCPQVLIPFSDLTEEEEKAQRKEKIMAARRANEEDIEARRQLRLEQKEKEVCEGIEDRAQYKCLQDKEEREARQLAARKREQCRRAYYDALKEKAEVAEHERICDSIDERRNCVYKVTRLSMDAHYNAHMRNLRAEAIKQRESRAVRICRLQQAEKRKLSEREAAHVERHEAEVQVDEQRRQCELQELAKQRMAYQQQERQEAEKKALHDFELRRFAIAERLKNEEANKAYVASEKRKRNETTEQRSSLLRSQRDEFQERRRQELLNMPTSDPDPYLQDDKRFFEEAARMMTESKAVGRPLEPIARAVQQYTRQHNLDKQKLPRTGRRSQLRDYCWPGFYSKAELKYKEYERLQKVRKEQAPVRDKILKNCLKISKMAAEERPQAPCTVESPVECMHHRRMPGIDSNAVFDYSRYVCDEPEPPMDTCDKMAAAAKAAKTDRAKVVAS